MESTSILELRKGLDQKDFSAEELCDLYLSRIHDQSELNAFITVCPEEAKAQAREADRLISNNQAQLLTGIPYAHKDIFCTEGIKTTAGSRMLDNFIAPYNATVTEKLNATNAICLGKTNMDEFAMGSSNENSFYGPSKNPWDPTRVCGGSSGGSAAAVAAGLAPFATGSDTGGSIRQPAAFCGLLGIKPTYGRVSRYGMIAFASSLDQGGVFTRSAEDAAAVLGVISGHDPKDSTSVKQSVPNFSEAFDQDLRGLKIGLPKALLEKDIDADIAKGIQDSVKWFEQAGATLVDIELPHIDLSIPAYYIIAPAEASSNLARYDGVRFGHRSKDAKTLIELYELTRAEGFGEEVKRRILIGTYALSSGYFDAYYLQAQKVRRLIKNDFVEAFKSVDVIFAPTTPTNAFPIGEKQSDPVAMYLSDIFTIGISLAGLPALSLPIGFDQNNLPMGMQMIGNYFNEARILQCAHHYQLAHDWHLRQAQVLSKGE